jgi:hypothetical protein
MHDREKRREIGRRRTKVLAAVTMKAIARNFPLPRDETFRGEDPAQSLGQRLRFFQARFELHRIHACAAR